MHNEITINMNKKYFVLHLMPNRPDFAQTMTDEEKSIMQRHVQHLTGHMAAGKIITFGPVLHPAGAYGLAIVAVDDESEVKDIIDNDPASSINRYEYYPMMAVVRSE